MDPRPLPTDSEDGDTDGALGHGGDWVRPTLRVPMRTVPERELELVFAVKVTVTVALPATVDGLTPSHERLSLTV
ncbi:MAG: hypothetical protein OXE75_17780 [bacterium]|nr:hypothetical protein [bacterium]